MLSNVTSEILLHAFALWKMLIFAEDIKWCVKIKYFIFNLKCTLKVFTKLCGKFHEKKIGLFLCKWCYYTQKSI